MGLIFITHDLNIVRRIADRVYVMRLGEVVEEGDVARRSFARPNIPTPRRCLAAEPTGRKAPPAKGSPAVLDGTDVHVTFKIGGGFLARSTIQLKAVDRVSVSLQARPDHRHCR